MFVIESDEEPATTEPVSKKANLKTAQRKAEEELAKKQACARAGEDDGGGGKGGGGSAEEGGRGGGEEDVLVVLQVVTKSGAVDSMPIVAHVARASARAVFFGKYFSRSVPSP